MRVMRSNPVVLMASTRYRSIPSDLLFSSGIILTELCPLNGDTVDHQDPIRRSAAAQLQDAALAAHHHIGRSSCRKVPSGSASVIFRVSLEGRLRRSCTDSM